MDFNVPLKNIESRIAFMQQLKEKGKTLQAQQFCQDILDIFVNILGYKDYVEKLIDEHPEFLMLWNLQI